mgnify:CR=1 FL=1
MQAARIIRPAARSRLCPTPACPHRPCPPRAAAAASRRRSFASASRTPAPPLAAVPAAGAAVASGVERPTAQVVVVLGTQWGDEGKGKLVDILAREFDIVARAQVRKEEVAGPRVKLGMWGGMCGGHQMRDGLREKGVGHAAGSPEAARREGSGGAKTPTFFARSHPTSPSIHPHPIPSPSHSIPIHSQGGANAGHTIYDDAGTKYKLHLVPSGILHARARCVVGNGVVIHLPGLFEELETLASQGVTVPPGRLLISDRAHLLFDLHKEVDGAREAELAGGQIGTTKRGIGPAYASKATRNGARVGDLRDVDALLAPRLRALAADARARFPAIEYDVEADIERYRGYAARAVPWIADTVTEINDAVDAGERVLVEGANATMLDLDFGTYPFVTSSNPSIGGVIAGLGLAPSKLGAIIGVAKAYTTRVGAGPYPTEIEGALADELRSVGAEYGTTTGRPRRIGWLDIPALRYASRINGLTHLNLTKLDVLSDLDTIRVGVGYRLDGSPLKSFPSTISDLERVEVVYEDLPGWKTDISGARAWGDLPAAAKAYIARVEELVGVKCAWIGVGPGRDAIVTQPGTVQ